MNEFACEDDNESGGAGCDKEYMSPLSGTEADRDESGSSYSRRKKEGFIIEKKTTEKNPDSR